MKIAFIGIRGIPVIYSGFESFAENLAVSLVEKKHQVFVYCRKQYVGRNSNYRKINLITTPSIKNKNFESISHSLFSSLHAIFITRPDVIYYFGVGNAIFTILPRLFGIKTIINVDGLDWRREKWGKPAQFFLLISEYLSTIFPNITITDSEFMKDYYQKKYHKKSIYIPYGVKFDFKINNQLLDNYHLKSKKYLIWVGRFVPDNHLKELIKAYKKVKTKLPLVIIGDDFYKEKYYFEIKKLIRNDKRIIETGFVSRDIYASLVSNSLMYIETKRSGGTHPSLIEAMKLSSLIISNDSIANKKILNKSGFFYKKGNDQDLKNTIYKLLNNKKEYLQETKNLRISASRYNWEKIFNQYLDLFTQL